MLPESVSASIARLALVVIVSFFSIALLHLN
jgi:hypothetical protein